MAKDFFKKAFSLSAALPEEGKKTAARLVKSDGGSFSNSVSAGRLPGGGNMPGSGSGFAAVLGSRHKAAGRSRLHMVPGRSIHIGLVSVLATGKGKHDECRKQSKDSDTENGFHFLLLLVLKGLSAESS